MAASLQGALLITWIIQSDFGLESVPLDYRISSRTKSCTGYSDPEENVFFSGKLSGCFFFFLAIKGYRGSFYHVTSGCFIENKLWACRPEPRSPSFPVRILLVGLKGRETGGGGGGKVKAKAIL